MTIKKYNIEPVLGLDGTQTFIMKEHQFGSYVTSECAENLLTKIDGLKLTIALHEQNAVKTRNKLNRLKVSRTEFDYYKYKSMTLSEITQALTTCVMDSIQNKKNIDSNQHLLVLLKSVFGNCLELTTDTSVKEVQDLIEAFHQLQANIESQEVINETSSN